ncbi:hypothetical protein L1987_04830 [Smallanthus sonchifolius]|uniref:Uncharacterized protein n=1 Tax=Smallanthus sonchifolius TaxID=185202 RepID=A0ACB9JTN4_9ASTR|nr:hypothetical protein L1987_04830 [Smallanthus sonchifolius]
MIIFRVGAPLIGHRLACISSSAASFASGGEGVGGGVNGVGGGGDDGGEVKPDLDDCWCGTIDGDIKHWAVGKEGNLLAILSSLQHVLWAGSGWQPVSLTDLIISIAVKKAN